MLGLMSCLPAWTSTARSAGTRTALGISDYLVRLGRHTAIMFFISRRVMRGREGKSLIITGIVLLVIGLVITVGSYAWASSRGGGHYYLTFTPIIVGIIAIVRGISQTRRGNVGYGDPGQEIPPAGYEYQQPAGYGAQNSGAPQAQDRPGYAAPRYGAQGTGQGQGQGTGGTQGQPGGQSAPNWYQDSQDPAMLRWWDGRAWTQHTQPRA
jgi:hypothetical protein